MSWDENYRKKIRMSWTTIREGRVLMYILKQCRKNKENCIAHTLQYKPFIKLKVEVTSSLQIKTNWSRNGGRAITFSCFLPYLPILPKNLLTFERAQFYNFCNFFLLCRYHKHLNVQNGRLTWTLEQSYFPSRFK